MSIWRQLTRGTRALTHRADQQRETDDELQHWLEQSAAAHKREGMNTDEAHRAARLEIGSTTVVRVATFARARISCSTPSKARGEAARTSSR